MKAFTVLGFAEVCSDGEKNICNYIFLVFKRVLTILESCLIFFPKVPSKYNIHTLPSVNNIY